MGQSQASSPWVFLGMALPGNVSAGWVRWSLESRPPRVWPPLVVTTFPGTTPYITVSRVSISDNPGWGKVEASLAWSVLCSPGI